MWRAYHQIRLRHFIDVGHNFDTVTDEKHKNHIEWDLGQYHFTSSQITVGTSMSFYPDYVSILSWFYPNFIQIKIAHKTWSLCKIIFIILTCSHFFGSLCHMSKTFCLVKLFLCSWEITKKSLCRKWLKRFHFLTLWIWKFGIFDQNPQGCERVKNSMGLLQGPRLMAWITKSPIRGNCWVPWGCRAHLGSVKDNPCINFCISLFVPHHL